MPPAAYSSVYASAQVFPIDSIATNTNGCTVAYDPTEATTTITLTEPVPLGTFVLVVTPWARREGRSSELSVFDVDAIEGAGVVVGFVIYWYNAQTDGSAWQQEFPAAFSFAMLDVGNAPK